MVRTESYSKAGEMAQCLRILTDCSSGGWDLPSNSGVGRSDALFCLPRHQVRMWCIDIHVGEIAIYIKRNQLKIAGCSSKCL